MLIILVPYVQVLQTELTPLRHRQARTHELSTFLMLSKAEDIARATHTAGGENSRRDLMDKLQAYLPASVMLPPRRLVQLLSQAAEFQVIKGLKNSFFVSPI